MITYEPEIVGPEDQPAIGPRGNWYGVFYRVILTAPDLPPRDTDPDETRRLVHQAHEHATPFIVSWVSRPRAIDVRDPDPHNVGNWVNATLFYVDAIMPLEAGDEHHARSALDTHLTPAIRAAFTPNPDTP